jgi:hypothetical protein
MMYTQMMLQTEEVKRARFEAPRQKTGKRNRSEKNKQTNKKRVNKTILSLCRCIGLFSVCLQEEEGPVSLLLAVAASSASFVGIMLHRVLERAQGWGGGPECLLWAKKGCPCKHEISDCFLWWLVLLFPDKDADPRRRFQNPDPQTQTHKQRKRLCA